MPITRNDRHEKTPSVTQNNRLGQLFRRNMRHLGRLTA